MECLECWLGLGIQHLGKPLDGRMGRPMDDGRLGQPLDDGRSIYDGIYVWLQSRIDDGLEQRLGLE